MRIRKNGEKFMNLNKKHEKPMDKLEEITFENKVSVNFDGKKYNVEISECFVKKIQPEFVYKIDYPFKLNGNALVSILAAFLDKNGKELGKIYIENGKPFTTVKKTAMIKLQLVVSSKEKISLTANGGSIIPVGAYEKREVILAATAVGYDKPERTFEKNLEDTLAAIDKAAAAKPDIIVSTECFYGRNVKNLTTKQKSIAIDSEPILRFREKAKKYNTYIAFSLHIFNKDGNPENLGVLIDRKGEICGTYAKTHITMGERLGGIEPGDEPKVFDLDFGRVAFAICWDIFFPGYVEEYLHKGVDIILNPTAGFDAHRTSERAKETGAYIVTSATHKESESRITSPTGAFLDIGGDKGYVSAKVDLNKEYYVRWLSADSYSTRKNVFHYERNRNIKEEL